MTHLVVCIQTVFQKPDIFKSRIGFDDEVVGGHQPHRLRLENLPALDRAQVGEHALEAEVITGGAHQPAGPGEVGRRRHAAGGASLDGLEPVVRLAIEGEQPLTAI